MPESCETCPIKRYLHYGWVEYICGITGEEIANKGRRSDCPLKLVEGCEYCNFEPESVYRKDWTIFTKGEDKVVDINYCPICGRRLEVE